MTCPYLRMASPAAIVRVAILWPDGMSSAAITFSSARYAPFTILTGATTTLSSGCSLTARAPPREAVPCWTLIGCVHNMRPEGRQTGLELSFENIHDQSGARDPVRADRFRRRAAGQHASCAFRRGSAGHAHGRVGWRYALFRYGAALWTWSFRDQNRGFSAREDRLPAFHQGRQAARTVRAG